MGWGRIHEEASYLSHVVSKDGQEFSRVSRDRGRRWMWSRKSSLWTARGRKPCWGLAAPTVTREGSTHVTSGRIVKNTPGKPGHSSLSKVDPLEDWKRMPAKFPKNDSWNCIWNLSSSFLKLSEEWVVGLGSGRYLVKWDNIMSSTIWIGKNLPQLPVFWPTFIHPSLPSSSPTPIVRFLRAINPLLVGFDDFHLCFQNILWMIPHLLYCIACLPLCIYIYISPGEYEDIFLSFTSGGDVGRADSD